MKPLEPSGHAEKVALFRSEIIGALARRELSHGDLAGELRRLSEERYRAPGAKQTRRYAASTLERWFYAYRARGLPGLVPQRRSDHGRGRAMAPELQQLLVDIRLEHPTVSVSTILRTLRSDGRISPGQVSANTLRRFYRQQGLKRRAARTGTQGHVRLRWQAEHPGALWHADVCHIAPLVGQEKGRHVLIHGILDDASRYLVTLQAMAAEREEDMLVLLVGAIRRHGPPAALYLDNGSTYRGDILRVACERLGTTLLHARPEDPQARGKMERVWRTLREQLTDHLGPMSSLEEVNRRLHAWREQHYHQAPHAGLIGRSPASVFEAGPQQQDHVDDARLRHALTARENRRVRGDSTLSISGGTWELEQGHLTGQVVTVARCWVDPTSPPWVEHEGKVYRLHLVDPIKNSRQGRSPLPEPRSPSQKVKFDPASAMLAKAGTDGEAGGDK